VGRLQRDAEARHARQPQRRRRRRRPCLVAPGLRRAGRPRAARQRIRRRPARLPQVDVRPEVRQMLLREVVFLQWFSVVFFSDCDCARTSDQRHSFRFSIDLPAPKIVFVGSGWWPCADGRHAAGAGIAPSKAQVNTVSTRGPDCFDWFSWPQAGGRFGASAGWAAGPDGVCLRHHRPVHYLRAPFPSRSSSLHAECPTTEEGRVGSGKGRKALP